MKRALVTGSAGLIGRHFSRHLNEAGWDVYECDLADGNDALDVFRLDDSAYRYDLIVHAAYHVGGRAAIGGTNMNLVSNLHLDAAMFDWAVRTRQRQVLYFSSSAAYPVEYQTAEWLKRWGAADARLQEGDINLSHIQPPDAHYGWAKVTGERAAAVARDHGVPVAVVRPFSGYADDQSQDYPFPAIVGRALREEYSVWGPKGQTRDWIHISDVVAGSLAVVESGTEDPINLCTGRGLTMERVMRMAVQAAHLDRPSDFPHFNEPEVAHLEDKPTGVFYRVGDPSRLHGIYTPRVGLEEGVRRAVSVLLK